MVSFFCFKVLIALLKELDRLIMLLQDFRIAPPTYPDLSTNHYLEKDRQRNDFFLNYSWVVILFTESQVVEHLKSCCKVIAQVASELTRNFRYLEPLAEVPDLPEMPQWSPEQACQMIAARFRDSYRLKIPPEFQPNFEKPQINKKPVLVKKGEAKGFTPSSFQLQIFEFVESGEGDGLVDAVAGSGKSTTLVKIAKRIQSNSAIYMAFNKKNAEAQQQKLGRRMEARTFNSYGLHTLKQALGNVDVKDFKYKSLTRKRVGTMSHAHALWQLASQCRCSVLVLHHENKLGGVRGTTAIRNSVSEVWHLRKGEPKENLTPLKRVLEIEKSRSGCNGVSIIELDPEDYSWIHHGDMAMRKMELSLCLHGY